jgi:hypothetical protein
MTAAVSVAPSLTLVVLLGAGGLVVLVSAYVVARCLTNAGYTWADSWVIEAIAVIGGIGGVQSYTALRWLAVLGDIPDPLSNVAPATVDLFAVAMGYAALTYRRRHPGERDRYADWLALSYSVAAVLANLAAAGLDVADNRISGPRVAVVLLWHVAPVITFLLGSHWLMRRSRPALERETQNVPELVAEAATRESTPPVRERRAPRAAAAPTALKESRVRVLLEEGRAAMGSKEERAALIARVAEQVEASRSYVRKIAGRLEQESSLSEPEEHGGVVAVAGER